MLGQQDSYSRNSPGWHVGGCEGRQNIGTWPLRRLLHTTLMPSVLLSFQSAAGKPLANRSAEPRGLILSHSVYTVSHYVRVHRLAMATLLPSCVSHFPF